MTKTRKTKLQWSMLLGGAYDILFGFLILFIPGMLAGIIQLEMPREEAYLRLNGLFLLIIGSLYILYWLDSKNRKPIPIIAIAARFAGLIFFGAAWLFYAYPFTFLLLALADGTWGLIHTILFKK